MIRSFEPVEILDIKAFSNLFSDTNFNIKILDVWRPTHCVGKSKVGFKHFF